MLGRHRCIFIFSSCPQTDTMWFVKEIFIAVCFLILSKACVMDFKIGKYLPAARFTTTNDRSLYSCAARCISYAICKSINFDKRRRLCHLNIANHTLQPDNLVGDDNYWYSDRAAWEDIPLGPCQKKRCADREKCVVTRTQTPRCESALMNIAKGKPASSSTVWTQYGPNKAVDGNTDPDFNEGESCFAANNIDEYPWWQVDLQDLFIIVEVRVTNRADCCPERLRNFILEVYKVDPVSDPTAHPQLCYMYNGEVTQPGVTVNLTCTTPQTGRYLRLQRKIPPRYLQDALHICEVQVLAIV